MARKKKIASEEEILEHFTKVLRGEKEDAKISDMNRAAEFLDKYYCSKKENEVSDAVVIVDDIKDGES